MVKQRMTSLDVRASVEEMRAELLGLRLVNLYDIQSKMFLFRFGDSETKRTVLLENGVRMHLTTLDREKPKVPSQFTLKLRKHVRAWRLSCITQLQHDRTIDMCFGVPGTDGCFHIIVELFSKGNVILTDHAYSIMMLLRTHKDDDVTLKVRGVYPVTTPLQLPQDTAAVEAHDPASGAAPAETTTTASAAPISAEGKDRRAAVLKGDWDAVFARDNDAEAVRSILSAVKHFGPSLAEHIAIRTTAQLQQRLAATEGDTTAEVVAMLAALKPGTRKRDVAAGSTDALFTALLPAMLEAWAIAEAPLPPGGYLIKVTKTAKGGERRNTANAAAEAAEEKDAGAVAVAAAGVGTQVITSAERYDSFSPVLLAQDEDSERSTVTTQHRSSFGAVCDEFFLATETEHIEKHNKKQAKVILSKREKFKRDFDRRVSNLEQEQELNHAKGELIILNSDIIDEAIDLINGALAAGIQWDALAQLLRRRHAEGHPVAYIINELFLERNSMTVLLEQELYDDEDDKDIAPMEVEVQLDKTAHANAAEYFSKKKASRNKLEKTLAARTKAEQGAKRKERCVAAKQEAKKKILVVRTREWWEKMLWFITSAGDFVLQGKDIQTTEIIVRRLMRVGDIFVHCDVAGALPCLLRPRHDLWTGKAGDGADNRQPVCLASVEEAGAWCVARSAAYEQKNIVGAWWVYASQLSGGNASGTYLFTGEKNHLMPKPLALSCGLLCRVERDVRQPLPTQQEQEEEQEEGGAAARRHPPWSAFMTQASQRALATCGEAAVAVVLADTAAELQELPSVEAIRPSRPPRGGAGAAGSRSAPPPQQQQQQHKTDTPTAAGANANNNNNNKAAKKTTRGSGGAGKGASRSQQKKERLAARRERIAVERGFMAAAAEGGDGEAVEGGLSAEHVAQLAEAAKGSVDPNRPPPPPQLNKHQRKKLRKIQAKYADQDDEDRLRGAMLNGNQIARVQAQRLEAEAEAERQAALEQRALEREQRTRERERGTLRYLDDDGGNDDSDDDEEEVELVDSFTDDDSGDDLAAGSTSSADGGESAPDDGAATTVTTASFAQSAGWPRAATNRDAAHIALANDKELLAAMPFYTPYPIRGVDKVAHVVCVCAPSSVLADYTFHVELTTAAGAKKGAVAETLMARFTDQARLGGARAVAAHARAAAAAVGGGKKSAGGKRGDAASAAGLQYEDVMSALKTLDPNDVVEQLRANATAAAAAAGGGGGGAR